jgi:hypothetical protein
MINLELSKFENQENAASARCLLSPMLDLFPVWIEEVFVRQDDPPDSNTLASIWFDLEYRRATIGLAPAFWELPTDKRHEALLHEIAHAWVSPLTEWVRRRLLSDEDELTKERKVEFEERAEMATQGLINAMKRLMSVPPWRGRYHDA